MQFIVWKIYEWLFIPYCTRKIVWLLVNNIQWQFLSRFSILRDKLNGGNKLPQLYRMKIWQVNSSVKISSCTLSKIMYENSAVSFYSEKQSLLPVELKNLTTKQKNTPPTIFLANCFSSGWETVCKKILNLITSMTKILRNEAKSTKKRRTSFIPFLVAAWLYLLHWTLLHRLHLPLKCLHFSSSKVRCDRILWHLVGSFFAFHFAVLKRIVKFTFSTGIL